MEIETLVGSRTPIRRTCSSQRDSVFKYVGNADFRVRGIWPTLGENQEGALITGIYYDFPIAGSIVMTTPAYDVWPC